MMGGGAILFYVVALCSTLGYGQIPADEYDRDTLKPLTQFRQVLLKCVVCHLGLISILFCFVGIGVKPGLM